MADALDQFQIDYRRALHANAKAVADLEEAEEQRKIVFSEEVVAFTQDGTAIGKAEHMARASFAYQAASARVVRCRLAKEETYGEVESLKTRFETWRSRAANARAERMMEGGR